MILSGWGRFPRAECNILTGRGEADVVAAIGSSRSLIARGAGRAYGDAALNRNGTLMMERSNRLLAFDAETGLLTCEAGVLLADIVALFAPSGWFPPVSPGTKFVTVGGMIAADVHGKNHHRDGSFGAHVEFFDLALASGEVVRCSPIENADLFLATIGGMGLTGVILRAAFRLKPIETLLMRQRTVCAPDLEAAMRGFEEGGEWPYSVAWIDCLAKGARLGRSLLYLGDHARADDVPVCRKAGDKPRASRRVPFDLPNFTLNRLSVSAFNALYYAKARVGDALVDIDRYFYPLDAVSGWNRIYGPAGFLQYQCVLPRDASQAGLRSILSRIAAHGAGSFLAVLKLFGRQGSGLLSFPMEGYTLALDFPANTRNLNLLLELDAVVADHGGRLYLAKDARAGAAMMARGYPNLARFAAVRDRVDPERRFRSLQSERLGL